MVEHVESPKCDDRRSRMDIQYRRTLEKNCLVVSSSVSRKSGIAYGCNTPVKAEMLSLRPKNNDNGSVRIQPTVILETSGNSIIPTPISYQLSRQFAVCENNSVQAMAQCHQQSVRSDNLAPAYGDVVRLNSQKLFVYRQFNKLSNQTTTPATLQSSQTQSGPVESDFLQFIMQNKEQEIEVESPSQEYVSKRKQKEQQYQKEKELKKVIKDFDVTNQWYYKSGEEKHVRVHALPDAEYQKFQKTKWNLGQAKKMLVNVGNEEAVTAYQNRVAAVDKRRAIVAQVKNMTNLGAGFFEMQSAARSTKMKFLPMLKDKYDTKKVNFTTLLRALKVNKAVMPKAFDCEDKERAIVNTLALGAAKGNAVHKFWQHVKQVPLRKALDVLENNLYSMSHRATPKELADGRAIASLSMEEQRHKQEVWKAYCEDLTRVRARAIFQSLKDNTKTRKVGKKGSEERSREQATEKRFRTQFIEVLKPYMEENRKESHINVRRPEFFAEDIDADDEESEPIKVVEAVEKPKPFVRYPRDVIDIAAIGTPYESKEVRQLIREYIMLVEEGEIFQLTSPPGFERIEEQGFGTPTVKTGLDSATMAYIDSTCMPRLDTALATFTAFTEQVKSMVDTVQHVTEGGMMSVMRAPITSLVYDNMIEFIHDAMLFIANLQQCRDLKGILLISYTFLTKYVKFPVILEHLAKGVTYLTQLYYRYVAGDELVSEKPVEGDDQVPEELQEQSLSACMETLILTWGKRAGSINGIVRLMQNITTGVLNLFVPKPTIEELLREADPDLSSWLDELLALTRIGGVDMITKNMQLAARAKPIGNRGDALYVKVIRSPHAKKIAPAFAHLLKLSKEYAQAAVSSGSGVRVGPVTLWLEGPPGVGKTTIVTGITKEVCTALKIDDYMTQLHKIDVDAKHWEGYTHQTVALIDDIFKLKSKESRAEEASLVIRMAQECAMPLQMAALESKGRYHFTSPVLILTSNMSLTHNLEADLTDPEAFLRRLDLKYEVRVKPAVADEKTGRVDPVKLKAESGMAELEYSVHALEFSPVGPGITEKHWIGFNELIMLIKGLMVRKFNQHQSQKNDLAYRPWTIEEMGGNADDVDYAQLDALVESPLTEEEVKGILSTYDPTYVRWKHLVDMRKKLYDFLADQSQKVLSWKKTIGSLVGLIAVTGLSAYTGSRYLKTGGDETFTQWTMNNAREMLGGERVKAKARVETEGLAPYTAGEARVVVKRPMVKTEGKLYDSASVFRLAAAKLRSELIANGYEENTDPRIAGLLAQYDKKGREATGEELHTEALRVRADKCLQEAFADVTSIEGEVANVLAASLVKQENLGPYNAGQPRVVVKRPVVKTESKTGIPRYPVAMYQDGEVLTEQGCADLQALALVRGPISKNLFVFEVYQGGSMIARAHMFGLGGLGAIIPNHIKPAVEQGTHMHFYNQEKDARVVHCQDYSIQRTIPGADLALLVFTRKSGMRFRKATHFFVDEMSLSRDLSDCILVGRADPAAKGTPLIYQAVPGVRHDAMSSYTLADGPVKILRGFHYPTAVTRDGDCGSPLIVMNTQVIGKIIGFHYAGKTSSSGGWSSVVTSEMIQKLIDGVDLDEHLQPELDSFPPEYIAESHDYVSIVEQALGFEPLATVAPHMTMMNTGKSKLKKSPFYGELGLSTKSPALLRPKGGLDPHRIAKDGFFGPITRISNKRMAKYVAFLTHHLKALMHRKLRVLTENETWNGTGKSSCQPVQLNTSPGWPYAKLKKGNKMEWVKRNATGQVVAIDPKLHRDIRERLDKAKRRVGLPVVWTETLKDETIGNDKVAIGKSRLFLNGPLDFTIAFRQYFGDFIALMSELHLVNECSVGLNPTSKEWTLLLNRLDQILGENYIAGDFSKYDKSIPAQFIEAVCDIVNNLYNDGEENRDTREALMWGITNAIHLHNNTLYRVYRGNPSGNPFTAVMNSLVNTLLMMFAWEETGHELKDYFTLVRAANFGDDNLLKVSELAPSYNMYTIAEAMQLLGIKYTPATKGDIVSAYVKLEDITYLKRGFKWNEQYQVWLAPLDRDSFREMLYWTSSKENPEEVLRSIGDCSVLEAVQYGREEYEKHCSVLAEIFARKANIFLASAHVDWDAQMRKLYFQ